MSFRDQLINDAVNCFSNISEFGEDLFYTPYTENEKSVKAVVVRDPKGPETGDGSRTIQNEIELLIPNDKDNGITSVNVGYDKVTTSKYTGGTLSEYRITSVISNDAGMWRLRATK